MKCDICGKEEIIKETDIMHFPDWWTRHWSNVKFYNLEDNERAIRKYDMCPMCSSKFKKLVKNADLEKEKEYGPECSE